VNRHPSELFIRTLVMQGKARGAIDNILAEFGLPGLPEEFADEYVNRVSRGLNPKPTAPLLDPVNEVYLREHNVYYLVHPDKTVSACLRILSSGAAKRDVYVSLLGRVPPDAISAHLLELYDIDVTPETVRAFKHYYFDVDNMSHADWEHVLPFVPSGDAAYYESVLNGGATVAAYRLGKDMNVSIRDAMREAVTGLFVGLQEIRHWSASPAKVKVLSDTVTALAKAHSVISTADAELANVADELRQFKLARNDKKPASLELLSGGNHSGSGKKHEAP
jgi:hypothetical protein